MYKTMYRERAPSSSFPTLPGQQTHEVIVDHVFRQICPSSVQTEDMHGCPKRCQQQLRESAALKELEKKKGAHGTVFWTFDKMSFNLPWIRKGPKNDKDST